ncbi:hypothetical protein COU78_03025 [Candidatus Peregrinibacteria bacterium CG10_big_fil_rev_8_21_14_0_10_49_24]|nr:MAG: hypothetical protein COV83_06860 [Candidatus Peregrinibacteria bacterium CG11_big_fil_rev_8_21_14_0_20_49_14]PIR51100.1 MAG: hypothetical protein COU78_03025 [Candidatus Peregrinibacteria bacterium CG10_big_fil_rev_8_21_14_0_10_49_24]PJA67653.1 MAG: hypothetical protein CO157_04505 [Candidatus Peregrinibacteria bacterium CG_4_9_14_3_um_filter_49_12]
MLGISIIAGGLESPANASDLTGSVMRLSEGEVVSLGKGVQAIVYGGNGFTASDHTEFSDGSAVVSANGLVQVRVGEWNVSGFHGAFHLSANTDALTVAALSTPVLVRKGSHMMIVPSGMQWRLNAENTLPLLPAGFALWTEGRTLSLLPERFFARQLQNLTFLPQADTSDFLPDTRSSEPWPLWTKVPDLRIGSSREQVQEQWNREALGYLRYLLEQGDAAQTDLFLHNALYADILSSEDARIMLEEVLTHLEAESPTRTLLLTYLIENEDFWLLSSLHPTFREETWALFGPHQSTEALALRLFMLPESLRAPKPVTAFVLQRWAYEAEHFVTGSSAAAFVRTLVQHFLPLVSVFEGQGYPERSRMLANALSHIVENAEVALPEESASALQAALSFSRVSLDEPPPPAPKPEPVQKPAPAAPVVTVKQEEAPAPSYTPDVVERRTYGVLRDIGALFTVETAIDAVEPNIARVTNILFSTPTGDRKFNFHFNVATGRIERVVVGNKDYPYSLSVEAFRDWVQG